MQSAAEQLSLFSKTESPDQLASGFSVRVSGRAKRLSIKVYPRGRVEVIAPKRARARDVRAFVEEHRDWIERTRASFAETVPQESTELPTSIHLPAIDVTVCVKYVLDRQKNTVDFRQQRDTLILRGATDQHDEALDALRRWLKSKARKAFSAQLQTLSEVTGESYKRIQIRGQKTCWGSHSSRGTISVNYSLLFLKPELLRYLLIHELCHSSHMNHSAAFWRSVERHEPDYRQLDKRLAEGWRDVPAWLGLH